MAKTWKINNLFVGLVLIGLCSGFPIGLENSAADYHTQFLTGLVGVLLTICGVVFLAGCLCCQRNNGFKEFHNNPVVASSTSSTLDHGHINPIANGEFTIFTPLSPPHHNNNIFLASEQIVGQTSIDYNHADIDVRSWFDGTESDFPRTKLKYIKELGKGWFGRVVEGTAHGLNGNGDKQIWTPVAVRILEASATSSERAVFLHDAIIYRCGKHPHILQLLGRSLESVPLLLLQELCPRGDLKKFLRDSRGTAEKLFSRDLPLLWCCQLSSALKHLHDHGLTHPDLAARNCQIVSDLSVKLGDYGLAASLYPEDYYQGAPAVPVRWCAPESLTYTSTTIQPKQITFESNVWSLGVTMWEIYECGGQPYPHLSDDDVLSQVLGPASVRLTKPSHLVFYTDYIFRLMQLCWSTSESRPSVSQVLLMLTDLMQVYQNTKHVTYSEPPVSMQDFDKRWDNFKPNSVAKTDNYEFTQENISRVAVDPSDVTVLNMNLNKDGELLNSKPMSPSLNNLHGSLDNLANGEMDSWLQKVATKTGDMSYVRGLSEAIKDLDNTLALENVSSSDSSHQPSPALENLPSVKHKLEFKLGPNPKTPDLNTTHNSSLTESIQRTSSESETEDETWRRKIERGAYSEKVHQKSKSVTDLMVLTHIDCSESDSETPLPSLDYRVNYKNVRYAPKLNLENVSLMFGSEGNLLSVHDKFQEELRRLQEERRDSLLFVPECVSRNVEEPDKEDNRIGKCQKDTEKFSSDETSIDQRSEDAACTYVNTNPSTSVEHHENSNISSKNISPNHRNPELLIEELSNATDIQPGNQVYNIFNVSVDTNFSPIHLKPNLEDIICYKNFESHSTGFEDGCVQMLNKEFSAESPTRCFQVPKLTELIQNNDDLMDYIILRYESQEDVNTNSNINMNISETENVLVRSDGKELNKSTRNPTVQNTLSNTEFIKNIQAVTQEFLQNEQQNYETPKVQFDVSLTQKEVLPSSMTHSSFFTSTPFAKPNLKIFMQEKSDANCENKLQFSSNFSDFSEEGVKSELKYSLETWDSFLGKAFDDSNECTGFDEFSSEPQSLLFVDDKRMLNTETVECKNRALIESFNLKSETDLRLPADVNTPDLQNLQINVNNEMHKENETCSLLSNEQDFKVEIPRDGENPEPEDVKGTFTIKQNLYRTFTYETTKNEENAKDPKSADIKSAEGLNVADINDVTVILTEKDQELNRTYTKKDDGDSNWEPGQGWFLHPQTNSEVAGQMEVSQGGEESYIGFSMDDEIMTAIRNELLMKLPQAQGQSSEQIRDSDEWDSEGRSEVLIKYNVYTTPLSPIPEESCSENDSCHFIYNRESSSDSENGDWPEPYEEQNAGFANTETRSIHNAESPIQEPQNRHTPSQDSCCSNDTLFNLEELTYAANESDILKVSDDLNEKKIVDVFEGNKDIPINRDVEESGLKVEESETNEDKSKSELSIKISDGNDFNEVNKFISEIKTRKTHEVLKCDCKTKEEAGNGFVSENVENEIGSKEEGSTLKDTNKLSREVFTCNVEPTFDKETNAGRQITDSSKFEESLDVLRNEVIKTNEVENHNFNEKRNNNFTEKEVVCKINDTKCVVNLEEETSNREIEVINMPNCIENSSKVINNFLYKSNDDAISKSNYQNADDKSYQKNGFKSKSEGTNGNHNEVKYKNLINSDVHDKEQIEKLNILNFTLDNCELIAEDCNDNENNCNGKKFEIIQKCDVTDEEDGLAINSDDVKVEKKEVYAKQNDSNGEKITISKKNKNNIEKYELGLEKNEAEVCAYVERCKEFDSSDVTASKDEVSTYKNLIGLELEHQGESETDVNESEDIVKQAEDKICERDFNLTRSDENIKSEVANKNIVTIRHGKVSTVVDEINIGKNKACIEQCKELKEDAVFENKEDITAGSSEVTTIQNEKDKDKVSENTNQSEVNQEQCKKCEIHVGRKEVGFADSNIIVRNEENLKKLEGFRCDSDSCSSRNKLVKAEWEGVGIGELDISIKENKIAGRGKVELDMLEDLGDIEINNVGEEKVEIYTEKDEVFTNRNEVEVNKNKNENLKYAEKDEISTKKIEMLTNKDEINISNLEGIERNEIFTAKGGMDNSNDICERDIGIVEHGLYAEKGEANIENIDIGFTKKESDFEESNNVIRRDEVEKNDMDVDRLSACTKNTSSNIDNHDSTPAKNDTNTNKQGMKNMPNEITPRNSSKGINEKDANVINVEKFTNARLKDPELEDNKKVVDYFSHNETKEVPQAKVVTTDEREVCDTMNFSLVAGGSPNYITKFLNHERRMNSVSSPGNSEHDNLSDHTNISLQSSEKPDTKNSVDQDSVNISDVTIKLLEQTEEPANSRYVNTSDLVNIVTKFNSQPEYVNVIQGEDADEHLYDPVANDGAGVDIYDALTDIRFTGPSDTQLMSTSFSESADIDEQDWDSGSDTRSSSSGEFIWKEGEHEESVKALRAAPQDVIANEKVISMEDIEEVSTESSEDEEGDSPEFVPSAWDKYATPTKSALRSPEKTLEKSEVKHKKPKGVWFKKQKYHCVYEYPREPESPNVNSYELWQPVSTSLIDWEVDTSPYVPTFDEIDQHPDCLQQLDKHARNHLYQLTDFNSEMATLDDEFFISSTARPFESFGGLSSQFFPGQTVSDQWLDLTKQPNDNITPDSGVEDITPSNSAGNDFVQTSPKFQVQSLKLLAATALKHNQIDEFKNSSKDSLGGLRHARNKLKLDLPPSPSAFTSTKVFTIEPLEEPVTKREIPTFTTFGKSRFLVQHVDTPTCDEENESKNVSFEALPYKPIQTKEEQGKAKIEFVRGEASLLDSADEDSGIESSTLERKKITNVTD